MKVQMVGVVAAVRSVPTVKTCAACKKGIVWALNDSIPSNLATGNLFNADPDPPGGQRVGKAVLWYEVTERGKPVGRQMFRAIGLDSDYAGDVWSTHLETCGRTP
jgi:hypothetical protein